MFQPSHYAAWWYPWFFSLLFYTFYIKNFHTRDSAHLPLKLIYYSSGHNDTNSHYFRSQFGDLCQKIQWGTFSGNFQDGQVWHPAKHNSHNSPPIAMEITFSESHNFSLQNCQRKFKSGQWISCNRTFQIPIWSKNTTFPENKKIVVALEHLLFGTKIVVCKLACNCPKTPIFLRLHLKSSTYYAHLYHNDHDVALDETSRQTSDLGFHPWTCCKHHYSFNLIFPCKFFYDRNSMSNVLRVILSGHIQRNLITVLSDSSQSLVAITTLNTQTTIERDSASGPLLSLNSQTIIGRGCSRGALPLYTHTTIERGSASGPLFF